MEDDALCSLACSSAGGNTTSLATSLDGHRTGSVPTLVLVGTRKGGTTALSSQLLRHPQVVGPNCAKGEPPL